MKKQRFIRASLGIALLLVTLTSAQQQFSANNGFTWLVSHGREGNYGNDISTTALAIMALRDAGQLTQAEASMRFLKSEEDATNHCWPRGGCKIKDTAFALWVLDTYGEDVTDGTLWLKKSMTASLRDNWFLEVVTTNNGTCRISYMKSESTTSMQKDIAVSQGMFPNCRGNFPATFFDLNVCLETNLLNNNPGIAFDVNCNELGPSTIVSVIYNSGNKYYLIKEASTARDVITIENGCFGTTSRSSCNKDTTLFANWLLHQFDADVSVFLWLKNNYDSLNVADNALLYMVSDEQTRSQYLRNLKALQRNDGSFNNQVFDTALATLALREARSTTELDSAANWLKSKQSADGSWENNVYKTALVLYSAFASAAIELPPIGPGGPEPGFCGDGVCDPDESSTTCELDCPAAEQVCVENGVCDVRFGENGQNCATDCSCGDGSCDSSEDARSCPSDCREPLGQEPICGNDVIEFGEECEIADDTACPGRCASPGSETECRCEPEKRGFPWWITLVLVGVVVLVIVLYLRMRKQPQKPSAKLPFGFAAKPPSPPPSFPRPPAREAKSKIENELEKSIDEAKKLFKKL